jgi:hypothetical protein
MRNAGERDRRRGSATAQVGQHYSDSDAYSNSDPNTESDRYAVPLCERIARDFAVTDLCLSPADDFANTNRVAHSFALSQRITTR